jgi:hypothetical protein
VTRYFAEHHLRVDRGGAVLSLRDAA